MSAQWCLRDPVLERLAQGLEDVASELRPFIEKEHAVVRQRHLARQRHPAPTDQAQVRDRLMRGATRAGGDQRRAVAGAAGNTMDARGLKGL
jgi:hypothetical protein